MNRKLIIVKVGSTIPSLAARRGDFEDWVIAGMGLTSTHINIVRPRRGERLPDIQMVSGIVVPGSHAMVTDHKPWSERTADWLRDAVVAQVPILGICYGHQLLAYALGGEVADNPNGREFGTVTAHLPPEAQSDPLLGNLGAVINVQTSHTQSVIRLPPGARLLASSSKDPHLAFAIGDRVWGVQFHPEFDADVVSSYISEESDVLVAEGQQPDLLLSAVQDTPSGDIILRRFAHLVPALNTAIHQEASSTV